MKNPRPILLASLLAIFALCLYCERPVPESEVASGEPTVRTSNSLILKVTPISLELPALDQEALIDEVSQLEEAGRFRFATARGVDIRPATDGEWQGLGDGRSRWQLGIRSAGATSLNLAFQQFHLPPGAALRLSGNAGRTNFAFTDQDNDAHGQLWTPLVPGDYVSLQLDIDDALVPQMKLALAQVNHGFRGLAAVKSGGGKSGKIGDDSSGSCNIDVNCSTADNPQFGALIDLYRDQIRSVGAYTIGGTDTCSGALINNVAGGSMPYFLTADHCGITSSNAASMVVYWNFENSNCRQPGSSASRANGDGPITQFNSGAIYRAGSADSDFALVELDDPVDAATDPFYAGWDRSGTNPASTIAVHHPGVSEKRISFDLDPSATASYYDTGPSDGTHVKVTDWDFGTTEGGSSGSPLFDDSGRIIGQLHGGEAACGNDLPDWYGRLSVSWDGGGSPASRLSDWLDPQDSGVTAIDGANADELLSISSVTLSEGDSGTTVVELTVTLSPATDETVSVRVMTSGDSATADEDFVPLDTILTFTPGQTEQAVEVVIKGDLTAEENETIGIGMSDAINAISNQTPSSIVILNDDYIFPEIDSVLIASGSAQTVFRYQITARNTPTSYEIASGPSGMQVDPLSGQIIWVAGAPGDYSVAISARNPAGADSETLRITIQPNTLAAALNLPPGVPLISSAFPWTLQTEVTNDGVDAARSGLIGDSQSSSFSIDVTGPDAVRFFWKVSSEDDYDFLAVAIDSVEVDSITGEVDWVDVLLPIPEGEHQITWSYGKDGSADDGADAAWVDELTLASVTGDPFITSATRVLATLDEAFSYEIRSFDPEATFAVADLPAGLDFDGDRTISGTPTTTGNFEVGLSADNGQVSEMTLTLTVVAPLGFALELTSLQWLPSGESFWFGQAAVTLDGEDAGQSGEIDNSQSSTASFDVTGPDYLAFWWKVSSEEDYDFLTFSLDGEAVRQISGEVDWQRVFFQIPVGNHQLSWTYSKDDSDSSVLDSAWLDAFELASGSPVPFIISQLAVSSFDGEPFSYQINAVNSPQAFGADSLPAGLVFDPSMAIISGQPNGAGPFEISIWAENASGRNTQTLVLTKTLLDVNIPPAIEQPQLLVQNDGISPWTVSANDIVGGSSAKAGFIFDDGSSDLIAQVVGPGRATFQWSVSSEDDFDFLVCYLDDLEIDAITGAVAWTEVVVDLPPGQHQIRWSYQKDSSDFDGLDTAWVDDFQLEGYAAYALENGLRFTAAFPLADPDADGFANLLEFVFATNPDDAGALPKLGIATNGGTAEVTITGRADLSGVNLTLYQSPDLSEAWTDTNIVVEIISAAGGKAVYRYSVPISDESEEIYFRLGVSSEP